MVNDAGLSGQLLVASAGTHSYHVGNPPDESTQACALERGYDLSGLRARKLERSDLDRFDHILAMDRGHMAIMERMATPAQRPKLELFTAYTRTRRGEDVPDPYYGGSDGFERVLDLVEEGAQGLLAALRARL